MRRGQVKGKTSLTIYYVGCQVRVGGGDGGGGREEGEPPVVVWPRNEFIKYFIRPEEEVEARSTDGGDERNGDGTAVG